MSRSEPVQFNVRSAFARALAQALAKLTGMTATQVVEEALRSYRPPGFTPGRLVRRGSILVGPAEGSSVALEEANAALAAVRARDLED